MYGPSDMYGDLSMEDVEEFEGLQPNDGREISPDGRFQRGEVRSFDRDFEYEMAEHEAWLDQMDEEQIADESFDED